MQKDGLHTNESWPCYILSQLLFEEVEGAYWFGPVRLSVTLWQLRNSRSAYARILV